MRLAMVIAMVRMTGLSRMVTMMTVIVIPIVRMTMPIGMVTVMTVRVVIGTVCGNVLRFGIPMAGHGGFLGCGVVGRHREPWLSDARKRPPHYTTIRRYCNLWQ